MVDWVYIVQTTENYLKIGHSDNLKIRFGDFLTGNPKINILMVTRNHREAELKERFNEFKSRGENYYFVPGIKNFAHIVMRSQRMPADGQQWVTKKSLTAWLENMENLPKVFRYYKFKRITYPQSAIAFAVVDRYVRDFEIHNGVKPTIENLRETFPKIQNDKFTYDLVMLEEDYNALPDTDDRRKYKRYYKDYISIRDDVRIRVTCYWYTKADQSNSIEEFLRLCKDKLKYRIVGTE